MTFEQQIISTFIGALAGFIFSIFLFYFTEKWKNNKANENLSFNLQKELDYNINFIEGYGDEFEKLIRKVATYDKQIFTAFRFNKLQRLFILEAFNRGLLYKYLSSEEVNDLDAMLDYFNISMNQIHYGYVEDYKSDRVSQQDSLRIFEYNRDLIIKYLKLAKTLKEKLKKMK
jgi:hypothetical protein